MPLYQFHCEHCDLEFDKFVTLNGKKPPERRKCQECGKMAGRLYARNVAIKGNSDRVNRNRKLDFINNGMKKKEAEDFYAGAIDGSKKRMTDGSAKSHYTPVVPNMDYHVKHGNAKPVLDKDKAAREKLTKEISNKAMSISKNAKISNNSQTIK